MIPTHSFTRSLTFTMIKIYAYFCLLSGLSVVQMKPLNKNGRVGESVTISCYDWDVWTDVTKNVKYFCSSPCTEDQHIIIKAAYKKTENKNGIKLLNKGKTLFVTFRNLQKSDSKTYYCGVERSGKDAYIEVILNVMDALPPRPTMTPKTALVVPTSSFAVTKSSTMSNSSGVVTDTSTSHTTLNTTTSAAPEAPGSVSYVLYLVLGVIVVITILMVSLKLVNKRMKQRSNVVLGVDTSNRDAQEHEDEVYEALQPMTMDEDQVYSTMTNIIWPSVEG